MRLLPHKEIEGVAKEVIGGDPLKSSFGIDDLRADADAVRIVYHLKRGNRVSVALRKYYKKNEFKNRFKYLIDSIGTESNLVQKVTNEMNNPLAYGDVTIPIYNKRLAGIMKGFAPNVSRDGKILRGCSKVFAEYIISRKNNC